MMGPACAIVDWGTSSFRLWIVDPLGMVLAGRRSDEGLKAVPQGGFAGILETHLSALGAPANLPVVVCGMAGARQGWVEARYCDLPASLNDLAGMAVGVPGLSRDVRIVPGLAQRNAASPDVMRGEETQLLGIAGVMSGEMTACLPGTHCKWVTLKAGVVTGFRTFMTGELYSVISRQTILAGSQLQGGTDFSPDAFATGIAKALALPAELTSSLFAIRAGELLGYQNARDAGSTISGLLIGAETAVAKANGWTNGPVRLIASGTLRSRYQEAFAIAGIDHAASDAEQCVIDGLNAIARQLFGANLNRKIG